MLISAELRWFWPEAPPAGLEEWFRSDRAHPRPAGGGGTRVDRYLRDPSQAELGIKMRGGGKGVELKGRIGEDGRVAAGPFRGPIELWAKWSSEAFRLPPRRLIAVEKTRWLRRFGTSGREIDPDALPRAGCNVELTRVALSRGRVWWTLGFEAFGALDAVSGQLRRTAAIVGRRKPPRLTGGRLSSYPAWLLGL